ncbi:MAG: extracellular solute-binding protein family 1 [Chloroflexi bacterium]|nr:extracellular solute-binding protein family 1 [Chloroflexota bacterium]
MRFLRTPAIRAAAASLLAGIVALGAVPAHAHRASSQTTLVMWWWGEQEAQGAKGWLDETIRLYEKAHPDIVIRPVLQTTNGLVPSFETAAKAHRGPDIQYLWGGINTLAEAWPGYIVPMSDYLPAGELKHYLNTSEDTYNGKVWSAPWYTQPSFPLLYNKDFFKRAGLDPNNPPQTWSQFLAACAKLKKLGVTPIAGGLQDGFYGGWLFSMLGNQNLNTAKEMMAASVGKADITSSKYSEWWQKLAEMRAKGYWNNDINSLQLYQAQDLFVQGKAAMTNIAGSDIRKFVKLVGVNKVGVMRMPVFGTGKLAHTFGSSSQTLAIPAFSQHKKEAAQFIMFTHTSERMVAFYRETGSIPADDRFPQNLITLPQQKLVWGWMIHQGGPYLENFIPVQLDSDGNFAGTQKIFAGDSVSSVISLQAKVLNKWQRTAPGELMAFQNWFKL